MRMRAREGTRPIGREGERHEGEGEKTRGRE